MEILVNCNTWVVYSHQITTYAEKPHASVSKLHDVGQLYLAYLPNNKERSKATDVENEPSRGCDVNGRINKVSCTIAQNSQNPMWKWIVSWSALWWILARSQTQDNRLRLVSSLAVSLLAFIECRARVFIPEGPSLSSLLLSYPRSVCLAVMGTRCKARAKMVTQPRNVVAKYGTTMKSCSHTLVSFMGIYFTFCLC